MEALIGRSVTSADRSAVFEAVADIQRHGVCFMFQRSNIYITERGVRFASASTAKYYQDHDELAREAEFAWKALIGIFAHVDDGPLQGQLSGSRSTGSSAFIMPRLPSPNHPVALTAEEAIIRWVWSITTSDEFCCFLGYAFRKLHSLYSFSEHSATRRGKRVKGDGRALLPPDDSSGDLEASAASIESTDEPVVSRIARYHPSACRTSRRLLLPQGLI